jgi:hypothetical protein
MSGSRTCLLAHFGELWRKQQITSALTPMPKPFYKHKLLLDEHMPPRQVLPRLNAHFDVKHIKHDLHHGGMDDELIHELSVKQGRIILTINIKDFRPLLREDSPGVISIPETWSTSRLDTQITALLMQHGANHFRGRFQSLGAIAAKKQAA